MDIMNGARERTLSFGFGMLLMGVTAVIVLATHQHAEAFQPLASRWQKTEIGYSVAELEAERYVVEGLRLWSEASAITVVAGDDIVVRVAPLVPPIHYEGQVAQANVSQDHGVIRGCEVRIDPSAFFALEIDARQAVMTHELGHCLGLDHSSQPSIMMNPYFYAFGDDDIAGITAIYGPRREQLRSAVALHRLLVPMLAVGR
jgi:hypothetical protein